ncbi:hypothetical protein [Kitasatospora herbaricolor]|uniref:Translation initiation factor IF-2 n=1 Tax=Kitasatospora herbaricolor TaxID=68217 RepID=A0ABZ1W0U2_9ACTN|nr:hypothetical protein [Kitasatospora herbaricolor]
MGKDQNTGKQPEEPAAEGYQLPAVAWVVPAARTPAAAVGAGGAAGFGGGEGEGRGAGEARPTEESSTAAPAAGAVPAVPAVPALPAVAGEAPAAPGAGTAVETGFTAEPVAVTAEPVTVTAASMAASTGPTEPPSGTGPGSVAQAASAAEALSGVVTGPVQEAADPEGGRPGRIPRPMVAAAVIAGLVLIGVPLGIGRFGGDDPHPGADGPPPAGYTQQDGGGDGFVPGVDAQGNVTLPAPLPGTDPTAQPALPGAPAADPGAAGGTGQEQNAVGGGQPGGRPGPAQSSGPTGNPGTAGQPAGQGTAGGGAAGGAAAAGGTGGAAPQPQTQPSAPVQVPAAKPAPPAAPVYNAVAGLWCSPPGNTTTTQQYGRYEKGEEGWVTNSGGYAADGCNGKYASLPMSGAAEKDDGNSVVWTFNTAPVVNGSCKLSVYVPASGDIKDVGGAPSYYTVQSKSEPGSGTINHFVVNQTSSRGSWVAVGTYPATNGKIAVMLHTRGEDWKDGTKTYAHHAASAVRANCTG